MKDLHSHLLYDIDDGSDSLNTSIEIIKSMVNNNIKDIILTPHYIENTKFSSNNKIKKEKLELLKKELKHENVDVNLYLGNEVYISNNITDLLKKGEITTLNNSKYLLIEFPLYAKLNNIDEILFELISIGCIPVLAHPERYLNISIKELSKLVNMGVLLQCNYKSLFNYYGIKVARRFKKLLKKHMVYFLGSDIHKKEEDFRIEKLEKRLEKLVKDKNIVQDILNNNFDLVINDQNIKFYDIL